MKTLSPSAERICALAVEHFAERGYDASSLNDIAVLAGMRKPSLYAHFASKDDLFLAVFELALMAERHFVDDSFTPVTAHGLPGELYVQRLGERYASSAHLRFLLRTAFYPPSSVKAAVTSGFEAYLQRMRDLFCAALMQQIPQLNSADRELFCDAWQGIIDSLYVELIYATPDAYVRRRKAMLRLFSDSLAGRAQAV